MKKNNWFLLLISAIAFGPLACSSKSEGDAEKHQAEAKAAVDTDIDQKQPELSNGTKEEVKTLVEGNNEFAFDLYSRLSQQKGNIIFSPYSLSTALAMAYVGARGETAQEMAKALHFTLGQDRLHEAVGSLAVELDQRNAAKPIELSIANSLWVQKNLKIEEKFIQISRKNYRAGLQEVDFKTRTEESRKDINTWVEKQTKDKIKELLQYGDVDNLTRLVLVNAVYLKANWLMQFSKEKTKPSAFEVNANDKPLVPMMHHEKITLRYHGDESFEWLELPYTDRRHNMVVILPRVKDGLPELGKSLTLSAIQKGISSLKKHDGSVALPRFKISSEFQLVEDLDALGMRLAFTHKADFSGITGGLHISTVVQKAFVDVDEVGTEAAAATGVGFRAPKASFRFTFNADHPFFFLIRDGQTETILFIGRVSDPR